MTAVLLAIELFAATILHIPLGIVKREQTRSSYSDTLFSDLPGDSSNKDLSVYIQDRSTLSYRIAAEIEDTSSAVFEDVILIGNTAQLLAIGSGLAVTDTDLIEDEFGMGEPLTLADGTPAVYSGSASYYILNDIPLPRGKVFELPSDFSGTIDGTPKSTETVYDPETDTVYIGCIYQLYTIASEDRDTVPVMSGDLRPDTFGIGSFVFPEAEKTGSIDPETEDAEPNTQDEDPIETDVVVLVPDEPIEPEDPIEADVVELLPNETDEPVPETEEDPEAEEPVPETEEDPEAEELIPETDEPEESAPETDEAPIAYLTYSADHNYMLSSTFTAERKYTPALILPGPFRISGDRVDGRDYFGQVSVEIDGETYILIGDRQQLDAINDDSRIRTNVCKPVFKATEGAVEVWRTDLHLTGDWIWLSDFDGSKELKDGNGYGTTAEEVIASYQALASGATVIYPGDADLIDLGADGDFSESPLYDKSSGSYHGLDRPGGTATSSSSTRDIYFTYNSGGVPDLSTATLIASDPTDGTLKYEKNGKYIVFRDIDMTKGALTSYGVQWKPLMFTGVMYGVKTSDTNPTLWDSDHTALNLDPAVKPVISNITVNAVSLSDDATKLDLEIQTGVGFFGTLTGSISDSDLLGSKCLVKNIKLYNGTVTNNTVRAGTSVTLVNGLLTFLGTALGVILDPVLSGLLGKEIHLRDTLVGLLNARAADPTSLATGAFAGRVIGNAAIEDCEVEAIAVSAVRTAYEDTDGDGSIDDTDGKIVGLGGFVGHAEGTTTYDLLSLGLGGVTDALSSLLNIIPGLGLGDLITVLLDNALPLRDLIPTGYVSPEITNCTVKSGTLSTYDGKYGVGGFAGSLVGTVVTDCVVKNSQMNVHAHHFGGGFAGVARDGIIKGTLADLGIDVLAQLHPQTELVRCTIENTDMSVTGGWYLGGFVGVLANSYGINDAVDDTSVLTVTGERDFIGGFAGYARLGTLMGLGDYLEEPSSLLSTVKDIAAGLLGTGGDQSLLDLGGIAPAAILGLAIDAPLNVSSTGGSYAGGVVGRGDGCVISRSDDVHLRALAKYKRQRSGEYVNALPITAAEARDNHVTQLVSVSAANNFAGGIAGYLTTANVGGLLGDTLGLAQFLGFEVSHTYINCHTDAAGEPDSPAYTVTAGVYDASTGENTNPGDYAGGAIGWAVGGDIFDVECKQLQAVKANNRAAGFVGATGPGDLANGGGLDLTLLGLTLLKVNNLLSLFSGVRTTYLRANVTGVADGFTVEETGMVTSQLIEYSAGGYAAEANSVRFVDCHVNNLLSVKANMHDGAAGGFAAYSSAGNVAGLVDEEHTAGGNLLELNQLIDAIPLLVPSYDGCDVNYVNGGFVEGDTAGGFAGDFMSGKVNTYTMETQEISGNSYTGVNPIDDPNTPYTYSVGNGTTPWSVNNIHHVRGGNYGGGWGGHVYPGALASAGGGLSILGAADTSAISATDLLGVADVYIPIIKYAGVNSPNGFTVYAAHDYGAANAPAASGYAGGFIGYGQSVQVSYSDVNRLAHRTVTEPDAFTPDDSSAYGRIGIFPDELESQDGSNYIDYSSNDPDDIPYAVAGAYYAGGYVGHMDIGSAASVGDKLSLLGTGINLTDVLGVLSVVVSTIEHSDVYGSPGGFSVMASPRINLHNGSYGDADGKGVSYAGGYAGKISVGHIQDGNCYNFAYIIGEIAAGGYVGEMIPGEVAKVLPQSDLSLIGNTSSLASLAEDFVPTIRNSETTCIPCGGAIRAETPSDRTVTRGMAGGYVGHCVGGQIWGMSNDRWKDDATYGDSPDEPERHCTAHRIRSVYGAARRARSARSSAARSTTKTRRDPTGSRASTIITISIASTARITPRRTRRAAS